MEKFVIVFAGEYDIACKQEFRAELRRISLLPGLILDFTAVTYLDSICIGELIRFHKIRAENLFDPETFVIETSNIQRLFELLALQQIFRTADSVTAAIGKGNDALVKYAFTVDGVLHAPLGTSAPPKKIAG